MSGEPTTKSEWERFVADAEADAKHCEAMLAKQPKHPKYLKQLDEAKAEAERGREELRRLRDPKDQLRSKLVRASKLEKQRDKDKDDIRQRLLVIAEAQDEVDTLREHLHEVEEELQKLDNERFLLNQPSSAPPGPMDFGKCIEALRTSLGNCFADPRLAEEHRGKKDEVEAGFVQMCSFAATLSAIQLAYETSKLMAEPTTTSSSTEVPTPPTVEGAAVGGGTAAPTGETDTAVAEVEQPPVVAASPVAIAPVPVLIPDGPADERAANRDRRPPPKGSRSKAILKMSDEEIAGPRKAKAKAWGKASA